jgi:hypothetical protein
MGLTLRDLVSSVTIVVMILAYASFEYGTGLLLSSAWAASAVGLVLGSVCAVSAGATCISGPVAAGRDLPESHHRARRDRAAGRADRADH